MRNRDYKQWAEGEYYHIYNRGNAKQDIFLDNQDYNFFLLRLRQNLFPKEDYTFRTPPPPENSFSMISYCLMPNHFHFLIRQNASIPVTKLVKRICTSYSMYFNKKYERIGHLFQDKFKQAVVDDSRYLVWLSSYIHNNPKVAGFVKNTGDYKWSSYGEYMQPALNGLCESKIVLDQFKSKKEFMDFTESNFSITKVKKEAEHILLDI